MKSIEVYLATESGLPRLQRLLSRLNETSPEGKKKKNVQRYISIRLSLHQSNSLVEAIINHAEPRDVTTSPVAATTNLEQQIE